MPLTEDPGLTASMSAMGAITPADLGLRSKLLVDKHAAYIASFSNIWEVGPDWQQSYFTSSYPKP
jgi:hypothetical protein